MNLLIAALAAGAGILLSMQGKGTTVIIPKNIIPKNIIPKKTDPQPQPQPQPKPQPTTTTVTDKYLYAKKSCWIYKDYSVNYLKTASTLSKNAVYEGEKWLSGIPENMYVGMFTGKRMNNMLQVKMNLSSKDYYAWVDESTVQKSSKYIQERAKNATIINRIINNYN